MIPPKSPRPLLAILVAVSLTSIPFAQAPARGSRPLVAALPGPFQPALRWELDATPGQPWIPLSVTFAQRGELVWAAPAVGTPHLFLASAADDSDAEPLFEDRDLGALVGPVLVRSGDRLGEQFALVQRPAAGLRESVVSAYDARAAALGGGSLAPEWTHTVDVATDRPSFLEVGSGARHVVVATFGSGAVAVDWLDPASGERTDRIAVPGTSLNAFAVSADAERAAVVAGLNLYVLDREEGLLLQRPLSSTTKALAISGDGLVVVTGDFGRVRLFAGDTGTWVEHGAVPAQAVELPTRLALSYTGDRFAAGYWNYLTGVDVRFEVYDLAAGRQLAERSQKGAVGGPQNFPQGLALTDDGTRAAFGLWGLGDARPEVYLVDVDNDVDVLARDLGGSVQALALDESGTRLALGTKHAHANDFATTGGVLLLDTGERDLQLTEPPRRGGAVAVAAFEPGQMFTVLVVGQESGTQTGFAGWGGVGLLDPNQPWIRRGVRPDGNGFATRSFSVPDLPELVGVEVAIQGVFLSRDGVRFSDAVLRPAIF